MIRFTVQCDRQSYVRVSKRSGIYNDICSSSVCPFVRTVDVSGSDRVFWLPSLESAEKHRLIHRNQTKIPIFQDLVARASLEQRKLRVAQMSKGESKFEQLAILWTINLNYIHVSRAAELLGGLTLVARRPNKTARKIGAGVTLNLEEKMESRCRKALLDNYHIYVFTFIFCIH
jgi:hypothetical protein